MTAAPDTHTTERNLMPGFIGLPELIVLGLVVLLVFGPKRLPEMGRSLGRGMREFKDSVTSDESDRTEPAALAAAPDPLVVSDEMTREREVA
jgi:sec-independent protein translocase protein TatA